MGRMSELAADLDQAPNDLAHAISVVESAGIRCHKPPTEDEKLDRAWQDFVRLADTILDLVETGAHLPKRPERWMVPMGVLRVEQAAKATAGSVR